MSYIEKNSLIEQETDVHFVERSKIKMFWIWFAGILFCWLLLIPLIRAIAYSVKFHSTEYAITNIKVIEKYGLINIHCDEMRLDKIENITIESNFWGNVFHYGNVSIQGTNDNNIYFLNVKHPEQIRKEINSLIFKK